MSDNKIESNGGNKSDISAREQTSGSTIQLSDDMQSSNDNPVNTFTYSELMEIYTDTKNGGGSVLSKYIEQKKESELISEDQVQFWEDAVKLGLVERLCRTAIMEAHTEDRKKDPLDVKIARLVLRGRDAINETSFENQIERNKTTLTPKELWAFAIAVKEVVSQKIVGNKGSIEEILNSKSVEILRQAEEMDEKTKKAMEKIKSFSSKDERQEQFEADVFGGASLRVSEYYDATIGKYVDKYIKAKREGKTEALDEMYSPQNVKRKKRFTLKDAITSALKSGISSQNVEKSPQEKSHDPGKNDEILLLNI